MLSKLSVKKPYTIIVGILLVLVLGYISFQHMTTDLLPSMNLPYVVVYTPYPGATPEQVEGEITRPMEASFATLTDVKKITSQSRDNVSVVIMQFNDGANMDTALIEISAQLDQLKGTWDDDIGSPVALKLNPDMLPVAILSVTRDDMDILELSDYVADELVPSFEALNGVASANASGVIEQEVDVTIEQSRIDVLNSAILEELDEELSKVERQLNEGQAQLSNGRRQLANARATANSRINQALKAIQDGEKQITPAIEELTRQRDDLVAQRASLAAAIAAMERAMNLSDSEKAALVLAAGQLEALKQQKTELEQQLAALQDGDVPDLSAQLQEILSQREELAAQRQALRDYISDLRLQDEESLQAETDSLAQEIVSTHAERDRTQAELDELVAQRDALQTEIDDLTARISALSSPETDPTAAPSDAATEAPTAAPSDDATDAPSTAPSADATEAPSDGATDASSADTTDAPSAAPSVDATEAPSDGSTEAPVATPSDDATEAPADASGDGSETPKDASSDAAPRDSSDAGTGDSGESDPDNAAAKPTAAPSNPSNEASSAGEGDSDALSALRRLTGAMADEATLPQLQAELDAALAQRDELNRQIAEKTVAVNQLNIRIASLNASYASKLAALETLRAGDENTEALIATAEAGIAALDERIDQLAQTIDAMDEQLGLSGGAAELLSARIAQLDREIQALEESGADQAVALLQDPEALNAQYEQAQAGLAQMDAGIEQMNGMIDKLSQGIIPGGFIEGIDEDTKLSEAKGALEKARAMMGGAFAKAEEALNEASAQLAKARKEFNEKRDEAFEEAGLDGVITVQVVAGLIGAQNLSMPAGYVKDAEEDQVLVRVGNKFGAVGELKHMKLFDLGLESINEVRLLDVARVELADNRDSVFTKLNGQDGILLSLEKQSTYSTADVADTILARAAALQASDPALHIVDLMNQGEYIDLVVDSVLNNLITGGALAILILLLFLLDWRPTLTVAFSIPISVVIAFVCMYFSGITLNVLSLSGLSLGIGMLVDNSIVSVENIYRLHGEEKVPLLRACVEGVKSVSGALLSSTLTTICVFLPIVFVKGMARDLFADMGLTIGYSLLASLLVAMTVVPMMTSFLMRRSKPKKLRLFAKIQSAYTALLRGALKVKPLVLLAAVGLLVFSGMQVSGMGISFMPEVNSRQMSASLVPDIEMSDRDQKAQATAIMNDMLAIEGVQSIGLMNGSGTMLSSGGGFSYYIIVDESAGRKNTDIAAEIEAVGAKYDAELTAQASTMDISMLTGSGISVEITGDDIEILQNIAVDVAEIARNTEGVTDVSDGLEEAVPELRIVVDKEKAVNQGLTTGQVYQFIAQKLMEKVQIGKITLDGKEMDIQMIEGRNLGLRPEEIQDLEIEVENDTEDKLVRIGDISEVLDAQSLSTIHRASQRRMVTVTFSIADGYATNLVSDAFEANLAQYDIPSGYSVELAGENETVMGIMDDLVWMILVAVLLIFLIMVAQFQSFKSPIIVMFTIPLAFTGGLLALLLTKMDLSIVAMLGFLVLSGVVVNNGIVFIDCVNQLRIAGMEKRDALVEAGRQRLRPILMTALTTILGMSTMALGHGTGAEMMQPMAVVSIGGLTYATLMTLFVVPVLYDLLNGKKMKAREIQMIREAAGMNGDEILDGDGAPAPAWDAGTPAEPATAPADAAPDAPASAARTVPPVPVFAPRTAPAEMPAPGAKPIRVRIASPRHAKR